MRRELRGFPSQPPSPPVLRKRSPAVWLIPVIATLCIAVIAGAYLLWSRGVLIGSRRRARRGDRPERRREQLPTYVRLNSLTLGQIQRDDSATPPHVERAVHCGCRADGQPYRPSRADGDITFLAEQAAGGTPMQLAGSVLLRQNEGQWESRVVLTPHPLMAAMPREAFANVQTIVEGSPEQQSYEEARRRPIAAAQAAEAVRAAAEASARGGRVPRQLRQNGRPRPAGRRSWRRPAGRQSWRRRRTIRAARGREVRAGSPGGSARWRSSVPPRRRERAARRTGRARAARRPTTSRAADHASRLHPARSADDGSVDEASPHERAAGRRSFRDDHDEDIVVAGRVVVPAGATLRGIVAMVEPATGPIGTPSWISVSIC